MPYGYSITPNDWINTLTRGSITKSPSSGGRPSKNILKLLDLWHYSFRYHYYLSMSTHGHPVICCLTNFNELLFTEWPELKIWWATLLLYFTLFAITCCNSSSTWTIILYIAIITNYLKIVSFVFRIFQYIFKSFFLISNATIIPRFLNIFSLTFIKWLKNRDIDLVSRLAFRKN